MYASLVPRVILPLYESLSGRRFWTDFLRLRALQWQTPEELETRGLRKLRALVAHAAVHVPYYRDLFRRIGLQPEDLRTLGDLAHASCRLRFKILLGSHDMAVGQRLREVVRVEAGGPGKRMVDRRTTLKLLVAAAVAPLASEAEQAGKLYRVGFLGSATASAAPHLLEAFRQGLHDLGWVEGHNIVIEYRWAEGRPGRLTDLAADLIRVKVDVIVSAGTPGPHAAKHVTRTIPIVMMAADDPVASGLVASLARSGGNVTGLSTMAPELGGKWVQLLKEVVPGLLRVGVLWNSQSLYPRLVVRETKKAAAAMGVQLESLEVRVPEDFERAFEAALLGQVGALITVDDSLTVTHRTWIVDFAARGRLPAIYGCREFVDAGGLMMYGADLRDLFRRSATYVDQILRGAKPADLPIERPTKFELVINLKTAKALGLTISRSVLIRADQVIE